MADTSTITIKGTFATREKADLAVEHLVQEYGIDRADVFVQAQGGGNSAGARPSGGDAPANEEPEGSAHDPALGGSIEVSADIDRAHLDKAKAAFKDAGASNFEMI